MSTTELQAFRDGLSDWKTRLTAWHSAWATELLPAASIDYPTARERELLPELLRAEAFLAKQPVEEALEEFINSSAWPTLTTEQTLYLAFRGQLARTVINNIVARDDQWLSMAVANIPDPKNRRQMLRWLFLKVWEEGGSEFLDQVAKGRLAERWGVDGEGSQSS